MILKAIDKTDLYRLIKAVQEDGAVVYAPVKQPEETVLAELGKGQVPDLDYFQTRLPVKRLFFPWSEVLYSYRDGQFEEKNRGEAASVVCGVRPCDARGLKYLDKVFLDEKISDPYYADKRKNTVILALACNETAETCFCTELDGSMAGREGVDVLMYPLADKILFEACSTNGETFMQRYAAVFNDAGTELLNQRDNLLKAAGKKTGATDILAGIKAHVDALDSDTWERIAQKCIGCGICTYLCPTCHCFGIHEEQQKQQQQSHRVRVQDSCQYPGFTREASAHNPRKTHGQRMKQRILHKFSYAVDLFDTAFCTGCGRCVAHCPVNFDIREIVVRGEQRT